MKNSLRVLFLNVWICILFLAPLGLQAQYTISFMPAGKYSSFESVKVHNLSRNVVKTIGATDWILLSSSVVGIGENSFLTGKPLQVYPNPSHGLSYFSFVNTSEGEVLVQVYNTLGMLMATYSNTLDAGKQVFSVSGLGSGNYALVVRGPGFNYQQLITVTNVDAGSAPSIQFVSSEKGKAVSKTSQEENLLKGLKSGQEVLMPFIAGDTMQYSGYSAGEWSATYTHVPTDDRLVSLTFLYSVSFTGNTIYLHPANNGNTAWTESGHNLLTNANYTTDGRANTARAVFTNGAFATAAALCENLTAYEFDDWYLPSKTELNYIYQNKATVGTFTSGLYWSSTEQDVNTANYQSFVDGTQSTTSKNSAYNLRCIRRNSYSTPVFTATADASNISLSSFQAGGSIQDDAKTGIYARGISYSKYDQPTLSDGFTLNGAGTGTFTSLATGLANNTLYYFRPYATNEIATTYGTQKTATTLAEVSTTSASSNTLTAFSTGGSITVGGGEAITARGVAYGNSSNPTTAGNKTSDGTGTGSFTSSITSLQNNTKYYLRAYATNAGGTNYGEEKTATTLANVSATEIAIFLSYNSFSTGGTIDSGGGAAIIERGVVYGTSTNPTKLNSYKAASTADTGSFSVTLTNLSTAKTYYRAYAVNAGGISYGPEYSITLYSPGLGVTDYDGNTYGSVIIGTQEWMTSNLEVTHYSNGTAIPLVTDNTAWANLGDNNTDKAYCWYNNNATTNKDLYGALYTYAAATNGNNSGTNVQGVCPTGWHLPSDAEWTTLTNAMGGVSIAGVKLKATSGWFYGNGTDNIGFAALPAGFRQHSDGLFQNFSGDGVTIWLSSTESSASNAWMRWIYDTDNVSIPNYRKSYGVSVRCVRD